MERLSIVKIGGNVIDDKAELATFLRLFSSMKGPKILVHGGGKLATRFAKRLGITTKMVGGRRITDAESLEVITMVYAGLVNKTLTGGLQANGCNAIGLSGADANVITAHRRPVTDIDFGLVGDIDRVSSETMAQLLQLGLSPVCCALTHDGNGQLLNTNADTIASSLAVAMSERFCVTLYYCFEKKGVLKNIEDADSVIETMDREAFARYRDTGIVSEGMLPKIENCFKALEAGVANVCIGHSRMIEGPGSICTALNL